jgi:hypothetical protein
MNKRQQKKQEKKEKQALSEVLERLKSFVRVKYDSKK